MLALRRDRSILDRADVVLVDTAHTRALFEAIGDPRWIAISISGLGVLAYEQGSKLIHDRAWEALRPRTLLQEDKK